MLTFWTANDRERMLGAAALRQQARRHVYAGDRYRMEEGACPACDAAPLGLVGEDTNSHTIFECLNPACGTEVDGRLAHLRQRTAETTLV